MRSKEAQLGRKPNQSGNTGWDQPDISIIKQQQEEAPVGIRTGIRYQEVYQNQNKKEKLGLNRSICTTQNHTNMFEFP